MIFWDRDEIMSLNPILERALPSTYQHTNRLLEHHHRLWQYYPNLKIKISFMVHYEWLRILSRFDKRTSFHFGSTVKWSESSLLHTSFSNFCKRIDSMITATLCMDFESQKIQMTGNSLPSQWCNRIYPRMLSQPLWFEIRNWILIDIRSIPDLAPAGWKKKWTVSSIHFGPGSTPGIIIPPRSIRAGDWRANIWGSNQFALNIGLFFQIS